MSDYKVELDQEDVEEMEKLLHRNMMLMQVAAVILLLGVIVGIVIAIAYAKLWILGA